MTVTRVALLVGSILAAGLAPANAADLYRGGSMKDSMPSLMQQSAANWYVRVDGGFAQYDRPSILIENQYSFTNARIDSNWSVGGGLGYYFNSNLRADVTVEHRFKSDVGGDVNYLGAAYNGTVGLKSTVALFNVYYDFDTRSRFTPYIGAGLGFARHDISTGTIADPCGCTATIDGASNTAVAAAVMAGMSVNLTGRGPAAGSQSGGGDAARNLYLDLGYRFLYMGAAETGAVKLNVTPVATDPTISDIHAHEFRVGLRYDFR